MNNTNIAPHGTPFEASGATKIIEASGADGNTHQRVSSEFEQLQRLAQPSRLQIRAEIVSRFKQGESINSISNAMYCSKKTVQRWVRRYRQAGDKNMAESVLNMADVLKDAPRSGRPSKRTSFLRNLVDGLVCLSPDNLVTHGLFGPLKLEFAGAQRWTYRMLAKATTLSVGTTYNYVKSWGVRLEVSQSTALAQILNSSAKRYCSTFCTRMVSSWAIKSCASMRLHVGKPPLIRRWAWIAAVK